MARTARIATAFASLACIALSAVAQSMGPGDGPPAELMAARRMLMLEIERLMRPIDAFTAGEPAELGELQSAARSIETMLRTAPYLFPPTTNLFDATASEPPTLALPAVWEQWNAFLALDAAGAEAAAELAAIEGREAARAAAAKLRASCDACHAPFLRPYVPATATDADREFDFESVLPQ